MDLSKRADDSDLNVKQSFADIVNNPSQNPIMEGSSIVALCRFIIW
jgi:hypothetical protein